MNDNASTPESEGAKIEGRLGISNGTRVEGASIASASPSRSSEDTDRGSGYGDFCFGRLTMHYLRTGVTESEGERLAKTYLVDDPFTPSSAASVDTKPFPFMELPIELRNVVYGHLLAPFLNRKGDIEVYLSRFDAPQHAPSKPKALAIAHGSDTAPNPTPVAAGAQSFVQYLAQHGDFRRACTPHPGRSAPYKLSAYPVATIRCEGESARRTDRDWHMLHFLRGLGNVSNSMRLEVGSYFWSKVDLDCQSNALGELESFLLERPLVMANLKCLRLTLSVDSLNPALERNLERARIHLAKLKLSAFSLRLGIHKCYMQTAPELFLFLEQLAELDVAKSFDFSITVMKPKFQWNFDGRFDSIYTYTSKRRHDAAGRPIEIWDDFARLKSFLTPFTLRDRTEKLAHRGEIVHKEKTDDAS